MKISKLAYLGVLLLLAACSTSKKNRIDLSGKWQFAMDSEDKGLSEQWFAMDLSESVMLPGSMKENGKGEIPTLETAWTGTIYDSSFYFNPNYEKYRQPGQIKFPFWLTPNLYYKGAAWYRKNISIPENWKEQRVLLHLERPHWQTTVWINQQKAGSENSLSVPHEFDITKLLRSGKNMITIRIDNRLDSVNVGPDSHSVSEHTQGNWNGIVGDMYLQADPKVSIDDIQLYPNIKEKSVKVVVNIKNSLGIPVDANLNLQSFNENESLPSHSGNFVVQRGSHKIEFEYAMGDEVKLWDEFTPNLYEMKVALKTTEAGLDEKSSTFGMREVVAENGQIVLNGRPLFLRGTLENNVFPLTGYAPTDVASWEEVMKACKESGLNHIRFHSHCPPKAAFIAADKHGVYLQPEAASWPNHGTSLGDGRPIDKYILEETDRIIKAFGNHPSFIMWSYCNEPYGNYVPFLDASLKEWKKKDARRLYTAAAIGRSWSVNPESEFLVRSNPRGLPFKEQPSSTFNYDERIVDESRPYVTHEMGQYCVFPDFDEIPQYTGVYKAKNFEMFLQEMKDKHLANQAHDFLMASGKLQVLCYKAEIEAQLRTSNLDGFQLLGLTDFPGQGSAIVGLLNAFWREKDYITKSEFKQFCDQTVPLAEMEKFVFSNKETFSSHVQVSHFGPSSLKDVNAHYTISIKQGDVLKSGSFDNISIPTGGLTSIGNIEWDLSSIQTATECQLEISVGDYTNKWSFWVFPSEKRAIPDDDVYYTSTFDKAAIRHLDQGGKVFLDAAGSVENGKDIKANFTPVFWNTSWFQMRPPHTLGILVKDDHASFSDFPTSYHSDYQWWEIVNNQQVMCIDSFPSEFKPLVQPIDTWFLNRKLAQLFEARIGNGKLMVSSLNLNSENGLASAQLKHSIAQYMNTSSFDPQDEISLAVVKELFEKKERVNINYFTSGTPDELIPKNIKKENK